MRMATRCKRAPARATGPRCCIRPQARSIVLPGQTSGTAVNVRVRALGGLTGYSAWSMDVTRYVS